MAEEEFTARASSLGAAAFDGFYRSTPPWEIGGPQPAIEALADAGALCGHVLDVGCGTGEHALLAAARGLEATGVDSAPTAIARAREKARDRSLDVRFLVGDALDLPAVLDETYDTVVDSALFHVFDDEGRPRYVDGLRAVVRPGGRYLMLGFSDLVPGDAGPRRLTEAEIRAAFADGWAVAALRRAEMQLTEQVVSAWLAEVVRA